MLESFSARSASQERSGSQPVVDVPLSTPRKATRCRKRGERSGSNAGGGRGEMNAVGRHASSGGRSSRGSGEGGRCIVLVVCMSIEETALCPISFDARR